MKPSNEELQNVILKHFRPEGVGVGGPCCIINQPLLDGSEYCARRTLNESEDFKLKLKMK